ncbi:retinoblastoma 2 isoform X1 [Solea senegalensis]|uniref:Retinoblastoma 2 isoform X1 n=1 Tax=Solea senegalensis TaxID=28829 RepID=A0AAV6Q3Z6_SOLSE|nr:retinoblastoma-like protein 2 isoform X2 [Solea senegalensis]KAG7483075.1 retinoblastoma 2 isoform X1 [Solea senegalensis]
MATVPQKQRFGPSDRLLAMFRTCSTNPTEDIKARLKLMLHTFLLHHRDILGDEKTKELAVRCCWEAGFWYYKILENLICQEQQRRPICDISVVLETHLVQSCLVACCLEISVCSNRLPCDLPLLLHILKMESYHFWRVIELVLRAEVGLPHTVMRHLFQVEEKVVEALAWTSNSLLWEEVRANAGNFPTCQQVMPPAQLEDPNATDLQPDPNPQGGVNRSQRSSPLHLFARKVYSLMSRRLRQLCSTLKVPDDLRLKIWTCFEFSLVNCTHLMVNRHLDQLLMCAIYIIAKITRMEISFKCIMKCYKSQPHTSRSVCKDVLISGRHVDNAPQNCGDHNNSPPTPDSPSAHYLGPFQERRGNLIYFYNQAYVAQMQHFAKQFARPFGVDTPPLSPYPRQRNASPRRRQLSSSPSISVSPYNRGTASPQTSGLCYYFNRSHPECLRDINNMIKTGRSPAKRCYAVSLGNVEEDCPSAKRPRLDDQSAWQRRLRDVADDRAVSGNQDLRGYKA